jgi:Flp pilus assembly protein TadG
MAAFLSSQSKGKRLSGAQLSRERGQSLLEFAITLPILLLLAAGTIEFGRAFYQYNTLSKAVREAARYISSKPYNSTERTNAARMAVYGNVTGTGTPVLPGLTTSNIVVTPRGGGTSQTDPPHWVSVAVTNYTFQSMMPKITGIPTNVVFAPGVEMRYVGLNAYY